jgi:ribosomal protein L37AE/L43A
MSEYHKRAMQDRVAARIIAESCESCERREFDYIVHDTFVCESCTWEA